ncbi:MAG: SIR2 family protein [Acidobacteria bacterium]|nr:SIR2 family protein [Acidobacteriota bacterium]
MDDAIRFSSDGPELPGEFLDSLLAGDVVFLCGTGVSAQMPDFLSLVHNTYKRLGLSPKPAEQEAIDQDRFEEVLGALDRRLADPLQLRRVVSELLAVPKKPDLNQHRTVLRLSHNLDNRISVVTTNFDTLLERAATEFGHGGGANTPSLAGQALPAPGRPSFHGIVHLHGRLADADLELGETPLVLTSTDYGDAYLRSGRASRFLFDLVRCKVIALLGYSASDAPFRYVLNVLEADRERFPDINQVYAFDAYEHDKEEVARRWETLAVKALPYCKINPKNGSADHSPLWRDL